MRLRFTKMQGTGNDFVVLDATRGPLDLGPAQYRWLADRRFGVGADQILIVGPSDEPGVDFSYRIVNADGGEVEQCGNGARCFVRYVREAGLTIKERIRVRTAGGVIEPRWRGDGRVTVDMGAPRFEPAQLPFDTTGLIPREAQGWALWPLDVAGRRVEIAAVSMGNPHAVQRVADTDAAPVAELGPLIERHERFPRRVNAGFLQVLDATRARLRVYERGAGETLACGTGACAAAVAGIRLGWLRAGAPIEMQTRGGRLEIEWAGASPPTGTGAVAETDRWAPVLMTGSAERVFDGDIDIPTLPLNDDRIHTA
jgi:diaminopimelate epimerase